MKKFFAVITTGLLVAACEAASPTAASVDGSANQSSTGEGAIKVNGAGNAQLPAGFGVSDFAVDAKVNASGKVQGTFRVFRLRNGFTSDFTGELTCLSVDPVNHRAWIGGVVTTNNSTDPNQQLAIHQPGQDVWFRVVDNEGTDPLLPDRTTVLGFKGAILTSEQYCNDRPWAAGDVNTFPVVSGDIVVKPKH